MCVIYNVKMQQFNGVRCDSNSFTLLETFCVKNLYMVCSHLTLLMCV
jgi:hypothetical protein